jgi:trk system potassium uptake protein TrkA
VPTIIAKANNERYKFVMESIGADTVIQPENEMGQRVGISLINPKITDIYQVTSDFIIMEIKVPELWQGRKISELNLREIYGVNIIGIRKEDTKKVDININKDTVLTAQDYLTIAADATRIAALNLD